MPTVDFHTHVLPPEIISQREAYLQRDDWFRLLYADPLARMASAGELIASMDKSGVDASVTFGLCRSGNDYVIDSVSRWPDRLFGFALVNPVAEGAEAELERCRQAGLCGLGELMPDGQGYSLDDPRLGRIIELVTGWGWPLLIHAGELVGHSYPGRSRSTLGAFYELALWHPGATLVAAHWGGGLLFYELMPEVRSALKNVYYDTAASLYLYDDAIFALAAQIAPRKVLFGTDYPLIPHGRFLRRVRQSGLSTGALEAILGGNAGRLLQRGANR